jgi:hypothetical protein
MFRPYWLQYSASENECSQNLIAVMTARLTVMYVPPIEGSEIRVWKADTPTNWIVLIEKGQSVASKSRDYTYPAKLLVTVTAMKNINHAHESGVPGKVATIAIPTNAKNTLAQYAFNHGLNGFSPLDQVPANQPPTI